MDRTWMDPWARRADLRLLSNMFLHFMLSYCPLFHDHLDNLDNSLMRYLSLLALLSPSPTFQVKGLPLTSLHMHPSQNMYLLILQLIRSISSHLADRTTMHDPQLHCEPYVGIGVPSEQHFSEAKANDDGNQEGPLESHDNQHKCECQCRLSRVQNPSA